MGKQLKVLITEDKSITALDLKSVIENLGFKVTSIAKSGEEALIKIQEDKPDLVLMDIMLNGYYTGIETAEIIKRKYQIPLIFLTALTDDETYLKVSKIKPIGIITKPFNEAALHHMLTKVFNTKVTA